jgi:hypothetical protein
MDPRTLIEENIKMLQKYLQGRSGDASGVNDVIALTNAIANQAVLLKDLKLMEENN